MDAIDKGHRDGSAQGVLAWGRLGWAVGAATWLLVLALGGCADGLAAGRDAPQVDTFFAKVAADEHHAWLEGDADSFLSALPATLRVRIAERALQHPDQAVRLYGVQQLYTLGMDARGDVAAADLVLDGVDLTGLGWAWMHSADQHLLEKRLAGIQQAIVARKGDMTPGQLAVARKFLCANQLDCAIGPQRRSTNP